MGVVIGIDVGGSTTKIVGFRKTAEGPQLMQPLCVQATDPVTSIYGAFGKFIAENKLSLSDVEKVLMTGAGSSYITESLYGLPSESVPEFRGIGLGGLYLSGLDEAIVVSMGTGTALIHAKSGEEMEYLGGTGVGGGTIVGLSKKMLGMESIEHITALAESGDLSQVDLLVGDIMRNDGKTVLASNLTASNFGKVSDIASPGDMAAGIINMVFETVGMMAIFAARSHKVSKIVLTGNLSVISLAKQKFADLSEMFGVEFLIPENSQFGTVIGSALCGFSQNK